MGTIDQRGWDTTYRDGHRWCDRDLGAVALWKIARIEIVIARIIVWWVLGQDHALARWNRERPPEAKYCATWERGMIVNRDIIDRYIA